MRVFTLAFILTLLIPIHPILMIILHLHLSLHPLILAR